MGGHTQAMRDPAASLRMPVLTETSPSLAIIPQGGPCLLLQHSQPGKLKSKLGLF